jgi:uncharacterized NAD(P)/FAD-binding protein YdhS
MSDQFTVAIVGAGFSGVMTAVHLLRGASPRSLRVLMVNRSGAMARGVAYGTNSPAHLLNVPAGKMSALPDDPTHFVHFAQSRDPAIGAGTFVRRSIYGEYLEHLLAESAANRPAGSLEQVVTEVRGVEPDRAWASILTADGRRITVDRVVMAVGHYPPAHPPGFSATFVASRHYIRDPWTPGAMDSVLTMAPVLLVGTGLTTLDVALALQARGVPGAIAVSRRGLLPRTHDPKVPAAEPAHRPAALETENTACGYARVVREQIERLGSSANWRQVVDSLRAITPQLWQRLGPVEKERFMRHLRPFWEVHRHRASPETGAAIERLLKSGWLSVCAGRFAGAEIVGDAAEVAVRVRGSSERRTFRVGAVLNCTGPATDVRTAGDPLLDALFHWGQARPDPLGLGIDVAENGAVISASGEASRVLYYVGPLIRARDGEGTAVPELRVHAARLARTIIDSIPAPAFPMRLDPPAWPALAFDPRL